MTQKSRMLAAIRKEPADVLPYSIRMDQWYNWHALHGTLPREYRGLSACDIIRSLGGGIQYRRYYLDVGAVSGEDLAKHQVFQKRHKGVEVRASKRAIGDGTEELLTEYVTPVGTLSTKTVLSPDGMEASFQTEKLFKSEADYPALEYLFESTELSASYDSYRRIVEEVGEDGLEVVDVAYSPVNTLMVGIMGYDTFYYELQDHPDRLEHLLRVIEAQKWKELDIAADTPAEVVMICGNWTDSLHTPVFRKYMVPYLRKASEFLHSKGKFSQAHIDGEMKRLMPMFLETGIDVAEAFTPSPMTLVTAKEVHEAWGDKVTVWGGIPSVLFEPTYTDQEFDDFVVNLFRDMRPGYNFVVGMGDNVPVNAVFDRVKRVGQLVDKYGRLPLLR
ncbi:MAG: uroporphyrinogen decarboxylase family protein [Chloroflexota bacterium]|nr:uroporphyrinogen decarboxylase family protein [Chloroflexota bacterium]